MTDFDLQIARGDYRKAIAAAEPRERELAAIEARNRELFPTQTDPAAAGALGRREEETEEADAAHTD